MVDIVDMTQPIDASEITACVTALVMEARQRKIDRMNAPANLSAIPSSLPTLSSDRFSLLPPGTQPTAANLNQRCPTYMTGVSSKMPAPPASLFQTYELADAFLRQWPLTRGYKLVIINSRGNSKQTNFGCWLHSKGAKKRGGKGSATIAEIDSNSSPDSSLASPEPSTSNTTLKRKRSTTSKGTGCPFRVKVTCDAQGRWRIWPADGTHNHEPTTDITSLAPAFTPGQLRHIHDGAARGLPLPVVQEGIGIDGYPSCYYTRARVYAEYQKYRKFLAGDYRASMKNLLASLTHEDSPWYISLRYSELQEVQAIYMMHTNAREILKSYWRLITLDCTYSTNVHGLRLLNIVGRAPTGQTYSIAHCFINSETKTSFVWALKCLQMHIPARCDPVFLVDRDQAMINALAAVFPISRRLLCTWHIGKAVHAAIEKKTTPDPNEDGDEDKDEDEDEVEAQLEAAKEELSNIYEELLYAKSEEDEIDILQDLQAMYDEHPGRRKFINYLHKVWLPYRDMWIAWRNKDVMHFGRRSTGAVESAHGRLKGALPGSNNTLLFLKCVLEQLAVREHMEIAKKISRQRERRPTNNTRTTTEGLLLNPLQNRIAWDALAIAQEEIQPGISLYERPQVAIASECECEAALVHGVPCRHVFARLMVKRETHLDIREFDPSHHLPKEWPHGRRILRAERQLRVPSNAGVDLIINLEEICRDKDRIDMIAITQQLEERARELVHGSIVPPANPQVSEAEVAFRAQHQTATKRMPSHHERVERQSKCRRCHGSGHTSMNCPAPAPAKKQKKKRQSKGSTGQRQCSACGEQGHTRSNPRCEKHPSRRLLQIMNADAGDESESTSQREIQALAVSGAQLYTQHRDVWDGYVADGLLTINAPGVDETMDEEFEDEALERLM